MKLMHKHLDIKFTGAVQEEKLDVIETEVHHIHLYYYCSPC
jgi:hypothetical protein